MGTPGRHEPSLCSIKFIFKIETFFVQNYLFFDKSCFKELSNSFIYKKFFFKWNHFYLRNYFLSIFLIKIARHSGGSVLHSKSGRLMTAGGSLNTVQCTFTNRLFSKLLKLKKFPQNSYKNSDNFMAFQFSLYFMSNFNADAK